MRRDLFQPSLEGEARLLLLIEAFSRGSKSLEGRTKLAKLDFFLRNPKYLHRALRIKGRLDALVTLPDPIDDIESGMVRYRYGPWDPSYYSILGSLIGKKLVAAVPIKRGIGYKVTQKGREVARTIQTEPTWKDISTRIEIIHKNLDWQGSTLKNFIYENFPEVTLSLIHI